MLRRHSSVGQSACLTCMRSVVRAHLSPPARKAGSRISESRYKVISLSLDEVFGFNSFAFTGRQCLHPSVDCVPCVFEFYITMARFHPKRGISAVGSAQHWQCWGQGFESPMLHQKSRSRKRAGFFSRLFFARPRIRGFGRCSE